MQKLVLAVVAFIVVLMFAVQGFGQVYTLPSTRDMIAQTALAQDDDIQAALTEIYFDVDIMGLKDATAESLKSDFDVDPNLFDAVYGKYSDGRFGIADVIIVIPAYGQESAAKEALQSIMISRINTFKNFDIYGATEISQNGYIFTHGDYLVLLMIKDADTARDIIEDNITR